MFSSRVYLAMQSACDGAEAAATALDRPAAKSAARRRSERRMQHGPRQFSQFIQRVINPMMRELFMHAKNAPHMLKAVISLPAGDIHGKTPIGTSLALFKGVYDLGSLAALPRWRAWRNRRRLVRDVGELRGENVIVGIP